jgi:hypothetical protein
MLIAALLMHWSVAVLPQGLYTGRFFGGAEWEQGRRKRPTAHPHRSRPYAEMPLPGSLTNKPTRVNSQGLEGCALTSGSRPVFPAHP